MYSGLWLDSSEVADPGISSEKETHEITMGMTWR